MLKKWLTILSQDYQRRKARRRLKWQAFLTRKGIGIHTRILEIKEQGYPLADYVQCSIQARIRVNGKIVRRWVVTMLSKERMLNKGDLVHIRYHPSHLYNVLVLQ
jgi:hypothetical protein